MKPAPANSSRLRKRLLYSALGLIAFAFLTLNLLASTHAWSISHYAPVDTRTTRLREVHTWQDKARLILLGPTIRRMANTSSPEQFHLPYRAFTFTGSRGAQLSAWSIPGEAGRPTVLMFPGYGGSKDTLLRAAAAFHTLGCSAWLIDFSGVGDSEGSVTTIGWREAEDVAAAVDAAHAQTSGPLVLYGTSMGAAAILCANQRGLITPDAVILECPFDRLSNTLGNRLKLLGVPATPLAQGIAFWLGVQQGFNGLAHNPADYAQSIRCPTLLMQGSQDQFVGLPAGQAVAAGLGKNATFQIFPNAGHAFLIRDAGEAWMSCVQSFLTKTFPPLDFSHH